MSALLNDLVDFARGRAGQVISISLLPRVDLAKGLASVVHELQDANPEARLSDEVTIDGAVMCDLSRLQQLLSNLIANAIAYGAQGTPIVVRAFVEDNEAVLSVTNQGAEIAIADLDRIFDPYWRSDQQDNSTHLGLGLHICSQVAKAHRGTLTATSSAHAGTRFEMRWPVGAS
jgi:signal transduction histidine kinase